MEPLRHNSVVRFGVFEVSLESGEVRKAGVRLRVQQQPMKVLEILLERPGEVVSREELRNRVWPTENSGDFDQAVNIAIAKLRSALGDSADSPRYIETLPKRGYRFIAEVSVIEAESRARAPQKEEHGQPAASKPSRRWQKWSAPAVALILCFLIFAVWLFRTYGRQPAAIRSLAVLPLNNLSGDTSQNYFADGMTDELITDLAQISALRVISRTSVMTYKETRKTLPQIAQELNVDAVVEGSVLRSGQQVRITAQLIEARDDRHLWAQSYEGDVRDTLALQKKVAGAIATQIRIELTPREQSVLQNTRTINPEAYEAYLEGRYFWSKRTTDGLKKAIEYFNQAIQKDPGYAQAYTGLADAYALSGDWEYGIFAPKEALPKAKAAAEKALELDNTLGEAHASYAFSLDLFDWNWDAAEKEYARAIDLSPGYATAHHWYAWHLAEMGRNNEALAEMRKAKSLDPLSLIINADLAELLLIAHLPDESIQQSQKTIEMDPNFALAHNQLAQAYLEKHMFEEALPELQKAMELSARSPTCTANLARAYVGLGKKAEALRLLDDLKKRESFSYSPAPEIAMIYTALGDNNQAMVWLEKGYDQRFNPSVLLRPGFDPLRSDLRFRDLMHRIGFLL